MNSVAAGHSQHLKAGPRRRGCLLPFRARPLPEPAVGRAGRRQDEPPRGAEQPREREADLAPFNRRKSIRTGMKMAVSVSENDCISFVKMKFIDNVLYFIQNLESDYFGKLVPTLSIIRNLQNQVLFINHEKQPVLEAMTDSDCADNAADTTFNIHVYKDSHARGMAVAISVMCNGNHTLSCKDKIVSFKEISPPDNINDTKSDMIFFQRSVPGHDDKMQFESSLYEGYFLACEKEQDHYKLILKKKDEYGDKSVMFTVENKD
ncbi:PREDICTED: interleukin-18 isoform X2 [Chinchilla lanigera]|nr:PREDICTED: interleukin-18 isoform X2 [Chinchilla lanigera]